MRKIVHILLPVTFLLIVLLGALFAGARMMTPSAAEAALPTPFTLAEKGRGLELDIGEEGSFPSQPDLGRSEQQAELDALLDYALQNEFEAVYYRAVNQNTAFYHSRILPHSPNWDDGTQRLRFFDPLRYLCARAARRGLEVFALTDSAGDDSVDNIAVKADLVAVFFL